MQVRASDGQYTGTLDVTVTVSDVNEAPTLTGTESLSYAENRVRSVATYRATDHELGTITWSLSGTDDDDFDISETGVLTFAEIPDFEMPDDGDQDNEYLVTVEARDGGFDFASPLDFENPADADRDNVYEITVVVTDDQSLTDSVDVTVRVTNHDEGVPTISTQGPTTTYRENGTSTVYTFHASDPQRQDITWSLEAPIRAISTPAARARWSSSIRRTLRLRWTMTRRTTTN